MHLTVDTGVTAFLVFLRDHFTPGCISKYSCTLAACHLLCCNYALCVVVVVSGNTWNTAKNVWGAKETSRCGALGTAEVAHGTEIHAEQSVFSVHCVITCFEFVLCQNQDQRWDRKRRDAEAKQVIPSTQTSALMHPKPAAKKASQVMRFSIKNGVCTISSYTSCELYKQYFRNSNIQYPPRVIQLSKTV